MTSEPSTRPPLMWWVVGGGVEMGDGLMGWQLMGSGERCSVEYGLYGG